MKVSLEYTCDLFSFTFDSKAFSLCFHRTKAELPFEKFQFALENSG